MVKKKTIRVGMYGSGWTEAVERPFRGAMVVAHAALRVVVCDCRAATYDDDYHSDLDDPPWTGKLDGALVAIGLGDAKHAGEVADWLERGGVPVVSIAGDVLHPRISTVCFDAGSIARLAATHLIACGCRGYLHAGYARSIGSRRRAEAFRAALADAGFGMQEYDFVAKLEGDDGPDLSADAEALTHILAAAPKPLGVLALGDPFARGVWKMCDRAKLQVPGDVFIVGVNDLPIAFARKPTLTSIRYPGEEVGRRAMQLLLKLIAGGVRPRRPIEIPATELIARESTAGVSTDRDDLGVALEVIQRQACTGIDVSSLCSLLRVSRRWLELEFRKGIARSPLEEINRVRLAEARRLLNTTNLPIGQIAKMTGFARPAGFAKFFHQHCALTPREFRAWMACGR